MAVGRRVVVVGEFGGGSDAVLRRLDAGAFDATMAALGAAVRVPSPNRVGRDPAQAPAETALPLRTLADFHPDALVGAVPGLALLRQARAMTPEPARRGTGPPLLPPSTGAWQATVDRLLDGHVRELLHNPRLRAAEIAWRGLHALAAGVAGVPDVEVYFLDVPRAALADGVARALGALPPGPAVLVADVEMTPDDAALLGALAAATARAELPLVLAAAPALLDDPDTLRALRAAPWAARVALAGPRLVLRPFWTPGTVTGFAFDESAAPDASRLLGGAPIAVALAIVRGGAASDGEARYIEWPSAPQLEVALGDAAIARITAAGAVALAAAPACGRWAACRSARGRTPGPALSSRRSSCRP